MSDEATEPDVESTEPDSTRHDINTAAVDLLDVALAAAQLPFQMFGGLSRQADMVEMEVAGGFSLLRFSDREDEGWPPFELPAPLKVRLLIAGSSVRTRGALFWCDASRGELEAELEALGATRSVRREGDWHLPADGGGVEAVVRVRGGKPALVVMQRRTYDALGNAMKAQLERLRRDLLDGLEPDSE